MRALQFESFGGPVLVVDRSDPVPSIDGVVIVVESTGLCRSDWHGWQGHDSDITTLPHVPGHELAGTIAAVGSGVRAFHVGDRVTVPFVCGCGSCRYCDTGDAQVCPDQWQPGFSGPGSFAEYVAIPRADFNLVALPEAVSMDAAAALGCRFATAYRAVAQVGAVQSGEKVVVLGCGGVGLSIVMIAVAQGAQVIAVDTDPGALSLAESFGAEGLVNANARADVTTAIRGLLPAGADVTFDALGSIDTCRAAVESLRPRGRHVQVGLLPPAEVGDQASVPMHLVIGRELSILGSHGMSTRGYPEILALVAAGRLDPQRLVTRSLRLDEAPTALERMGIDPTPGVSIIHPQMSP
ncbi:MAG: alcohol dehydrogenase catalytic domain-containing protein [Actinobacteria bacterium]|nr:alcohol dehydrogenase catalytic domain-containing protein [Actinomycetota bacterium]